MVGRSGAQLRANREKAELWLASGDVESTPEYKQTLERLTELSDLCSAEAGEIVDSSALGSIALNISRHHGNSATSLETMLPAHDRGRMLIDVAVPSLGCRVRP